MKTTGKFDCKGEEIFEGDKVIHAWGWFRWEGELKTTYRIHTITVKPAHMMANGQMHDDGGGIIFNLGTAYNFWKGEEVSKITPEQAAEIGMKDDQEYFLDKDGKAVRCTDQHLMGLNDEDWQKELTKRREWERNLFFNKP